MRRVRVKICGITRPEDALAAAALGVDAIGLVFFPGSARAVDAAQAKRIIGVLPPFVTSVGLFVDAAAELVSAVLRQVPVDLLQFHGSEEPEYCAAFSRPFIKAVPMGSGADVPSYVRGFQKAAALLLDSHGGTKTGGSGECFDWSSIPTGLAKPVILAGGLGPDNVGRAVRQVRPFAVDVSSGVESAKGIKDIGLMRAFMRSIEHV